MLKRTASTGHFQHIPSTDVYFRVISAELFPAVRVCGFLYVTLYLFLVSDSFFYIGSLQNARSVNRQKRAQFEGSSHHDRSVVTVVSAYYNLHSPKHSHGDYAVWMSNFLSEVPCYLYIFTDDESYPMLRELRSAHLNRTKFLIKPFEELRMAKLGEAFWRKHYDMDPRWKRHNSRLYIIWNEKTNFVMDAIGDDPFNSDYFIWCDIGSFRNASRLPQLRTFPNEKKISQLDSTKIHMEILYPFRRRDYALLPNNGLPVRRFQKEVRLAGGFMVGHRRAWQKWNGIFYETLMRMSEANRFVGDDQIVMVNVAVLHPELTKFITPKPYFNDTGDGWFYFQYLFS
ncbi:hypothetical protein BV898_03495 [Hypsibius exemplaris]|uniref:Uncharacterized protein n=1 Tax=Hypsibius exemplaris TaxID=2072580 RepID=A0A1W0X5P7_HYPEX|nr:hypothetical protein BV898_03495 [Hypsibius exemplaris]